jgi:hypothetical protein
MPLVNKINRLAKTYIGAKIMKIKLKVVNIKGETFFIEIPQCIKINRDFLVFMETLYGEVADISTLSTIDVSVI